MAEQQTDWVEWLAGQGGTTAQNVRLPSEPAIAASPPQGFYAYLAWLKHSEIAELQAEKTRLLQRQAAELNRSDRRQVMLWLSVVEAELRMRDFTAGTDRNTVGQ